MAQVINFDHLESADRPFNLIILNHLQRNAEDNDEDRVDEFKKVILKNNVYYPLPFCEFSQMLILRIKAIQEIKGEESIKEKTSSIFSDFVTKHYREKNDIEKPVIQKIKEISSEQNMEIYLGKIKKKRTHKKRPKTTYLRKTNKNKPRTKLNQEKKRKKRFKRLWNKSYKAYNEAIKKIKAIENEYQIKEKEIQKHIHWSLSIRKPVNLEATIHFDKKDYTITYEDPRKGRVPSKENESVTYATSHSRGYVGRDDIGKLGDVPNFRKISVQNTGDKAKPFFHYYRHGSLPVYQHYTRWDQVLSLFGVKRKSLAPVYKALLESMINKINDFSEDRQSTIHENMVHLISPSQGRSFIADSDKNSFNFENSWLVHEIFKRYKYKIGDDATYESNYMCFGINWASKFTTSQQDKVNAQGLYHLRLQMIQKLSDLSDHPCFEEIREFLMPAESDKIKQKISDLNEKINSLRDELIGDINKHSEEKFIKKFGEIEKLIKQRQKLELELQENYLKQEGFAKGKKLLELIDNIDKKLNGQDPAYPKLILNEDERKALKLLKMYADIERFYHSGDWRKGKHAGKMQALILNLSHEAEVIGSTGCKSCADRGPAVGRQAVYLAMKNQEDYTPFYGVESDKMIHDPFKVGFSEDFLPSYLDTNLDGLAHQQNQGTAGGKYKTDRETSKHCVSLRKAREAKAFTETFIETFTEKFKSVKASLIVIFKKPAMASDIDSAPESELPTQETRHFSSRTLTANIHAQQSADNNNGPASPLPHSFDNGAGLGSHESSD